MSRRDCRDWPNLWRRAIAADDPDVALILVGRWETMDRILDGRWSHVGEPAFDAYLRSELELAIATAGAHGARVLLATAPYNRRGEQLDGSLFPEDHPERVTAWNALLRDVAADHRDVGVVDFGARDLAGRRVHLDGRGRPGQVRRGAPDPVRRPGLDRPLAVPSARPRGWER